MRDVGILPVLKDRQHEDDAADGQVIPRGHFQIEVAVQKRIDQRQETQGGEKPVRESNFTFAARQQAAKRKRRYAESQKQIFPQNFENRMIQRDQDKGRDHQPKAQTQI